MDTVNAYVQSDGSTVASATRHRQLAIATVITKRTGLFSPFVGVALHHNQMVVHGDGVQPQEHKNTAVVSTGLGIFRRKSYET